MTESFIAPEVGARRQSAPSLARTEVASDEETRVESALNDFASTSSARVEVAPSEAAKVEAARVASVRVEAVCSRREREEFCAFPEQLARDNGLRDFVPSLRFDERAWLRGRHPFFGGGRDAQALSFLARNASGQIVGRVAAIHNRAFVRASRERGNTSDARTGFFGFFDAVNDEGVVRSLLNAASDWLRERGLCRIIGPASPSQNGPFGVLVDGLDAPHRFLLPFNAPYYDALLRSCGLQTSRDLWCYTVQLSGETARQAQTQSEDFKRIWDARMPDLRVRSFEMAHFERDLRLLQRAFDEFLRDHWLRTPMNDAEVRRFGAMLRFLIDPDFVLFAFRGEQLVGALVGVPDLNIALRQVRHRGALELLEAAWLLRTARTRGDFSCVRIVLLGVTSDERARLGVAPALLWQLHANALKRGLTHLDAHWVEAENRAMLNLLAGRGAFPDRTYRVYERSLSS